MRPCPVRSGHVYDYIEEHFTELANIKVMQKMLEDLEIELEFV